MKVYFASDHAGFALKEILMPFVRSLGYEVEDCGPLEYDEMDDYPDFISRAAGAVSNSTEVSRGIVIGGSGQGEAMVANRFPNVRAAVYTGQYQPADGRNVPDTIALSRLDNDANVLSLGARFLTAEEAQAAVQKWLETPFSEEVRHKRRIEKIEEYS